MTLCSVLIIDDDRDDIEILTEAFAACAVYEIHYVHSAIQAFTYLQTIQHNFLPKLVVIESYPQRISGAKFLKELKGLDKYKHIPVIILSCIEEDGEKIESYKEMGALAYLIKPSSYKEYVKVAADMKKRVGV